MHLLVKGTESRLTGEALVPNSKYHAHRALILASLAPGVSRITGLSDARHVQYTVGLLRGLGTKIDIEGDTFIVHGGPYRPVRDSVSAGSSGTTLYFMIGLASLAETPVVVTGQKYFQRRPVGPLLRSLQQMGVELESADDCPPISVAAKRPTGGHVTIAGTLSQWISGLILLAPFATGKTVIEVEGELNEQPYIELTVEMMKQFGLTVKASPDWRRFEIEPNQQAVPCDLTMPPDIGSAAFGIAAAALHPSDILLRGLHQLSGGPADHPEVHFLDIAREMGVPMELTEDGVRIRHDGIRLNPTKIDCRGIPDMLPILSVMGTFADGETTFSNIAHVRLKESDRVSAMLQLNQMGGDLDLDGDILRVRGVDRLTGAKLSSFNDHRVLMSLAVAASTARGDSTLTYPNAYRISYPAYLEAMNGFGIPMTVEGGKPSKDERPQRRLPIQASRPDLAAKTTLSDWLARWAEERPDDLAVLDARPRSTNKITWGELDRRVDVVASQLIKLGVQPGEPVALQLPNWTEFVIIALATMRIGAVCCPLMPIFREREIAFMLRRAKARVLFVPETFRGREYAGEISRLVDGDGAEPPADLRHVVVLPGDVQSGGDWVPGPVAWHDWNDLLSGEVDQEALAQRKPSPEQTAQLLFTSGTTGEPKGSLMTGGTLSRAASMEIKHLGLDASDAVYIPSPLAHQTGFLYGMWLAMELGVPQIIQAVWDPRRALAALREGGGSFVQAATPFLADLVKAVEAGEEAPPKLRIFVATGAAVPRGLAERATRVLGTAVCGAFGTTETCLGALSAPTDEAVKVWGTDGRALDGIKLRITDDNGRVLAAGTEGNFEILSPTYFEGYLDRPDLTAQAYTEDGWYKTGDLGIIDESGFIRITGRVKDVINRGGEKVPVAEIENLIYDHPSVDDVAVVAMPDERLGERACAFVVLKGGQSLDFEDMIKYLDDHQVAKYYWPERLQLIDVLPRNAAGKIQKFLLREQAKELRPQRIEGK
ncbi:MAG TPA: 3-phosphoshikimate 1-carboxyvinyltransferase [Microlunatus sp.]